MQKGAAATGAIALGTVGLSGTAAASDCPRTPGFWANHDWCDVPVAPADPGQGSVAEAMGLTCNGTASGTSELAGTGVAKTMTEWQAFLLAPPRGDKSIKMAQTLLATALNWQRRPGDDPDCVDATLDLSGYGLGETTVRCVYVAAGEWLRQSAFGDPETTQPAWAPPTVEVAQGCTTNDLSGTGTVTTGGEALKDALDAFNNGWLGLDCDCSGEEDGGNDGRTTGDETPAKDEPSKDDGGGPPEDAGPPDHAGPPEDAGKGRGPDDESKGGEGRGRGNGKGGP